MFVEWLSNTRPPRGAGAGMPVRLETKPTGGLLNPQHYNRSTSGAEGGHDPLRHGDQGNLLGEGPLKCGHEGE